MNKSMLYAGLMTILSATAYAEDSSNLQMPAGAILQQGVRLAASDSVQTPSNTPIQTPSDSGSKPPSVGTPTSATGATPTPAPNNSTPPPSGATVPAAANTKPAPAPAPAAAPSPTATPETKPTTPAAQPATTPATALTPAKPLDCDYRIPAETTHIEQTIVMKWAEKAAEQSFDFDFNTVDKQIAQLKTCYTDQGWQGFNDALQKSGNINAIKTQQLTVSSMVNGESKITELKDNQWKISIPMQVVYQNNKEKLTQPLTVNLIVGRKTTGDLGIMQMIAIPRQPISNAGAESAAETAATPKP